MLVYAFEQGGATTAALVAVVQLVPAALFAPVAASLGDRYRSSLVLVAGYVAQATGMGATSVVLLADGPPLGAYALAAVAATAVTITRPAQAALMPSLARTPEELTAANVVSGWIESVSVLVAPALAAVLLGAGGAGAVFAVMAVVAAAAAVLVAPVESPRPVGGGPMIAAMLEGLGVVARERGPRALVWLLGVEALAIGALDVLYVVLAVDVLGLAGNTAGYLNAAFGVGGVVAVGVTVTLVGRQRLAPALLLGLALWAFALASIALSTSFAAAFLLLAAAGVGRTTLDVAGRTLLQRIATPAALGRVFGLLEGLTMTGLAVGSVLAAAFVALAGGRGAFVYLAAILPLAAALVARSVVAADAAALPVVEMARLRALSIFAYLGPAELEAAARSVEPVELPAGTVVIREGEAGDSFYVVADGEVVVSQRGTRVRELGRGECFGAIALVRDVPRTATVVAKTDVRLDSLDQAAFLRAVTGHERTARHADELVASHLLHGASPP
jgi:MFS family permease